MEPQNQKSLERLISQRAMQLGSSFPCQIWALGFICGVCITYLFLVASTPYRTQTQLGFVYDTSRGAILPNSSSLHLDIKRSENSFVSSKDLEGSKNTHKSGEQRDEKIFLLFSAWSSILDRSRNIGELKGMTVPKAPHLEDCPTKEEINRNLDRRGENGSSPHWTLWRGSLGIELLRTASKSGQVPDGYNTEFEGAYPPWVVRSDEDNFPYTRRVQHDLWMHQHPENCNDPHLRFLVADWEKLPGFGIGAQLAGMTGLLAIAINENRILVTNYYNRADHDGCQGSSRSHWSCYFFPETAQECRERAFELMRSKEAWDNKIITVKENYTSKEIWAGSIPRVWGEPWSYLQPTTEIDGSLLMHHRKMDRRWWRAQVPSDISQTDINQFVWSSHSPWIPRPLLSMHVRMGDKACEMKVFGFESYMQLANRIRKHFPNLNSIWLSTEMQEVIDKSRIYPRWNFYYTNVTRQVGNITMAKYEASLGRETSTNYPLVNFLMATEADFFIGALGSTWCYLIDGMRNTGGKVMSGYLSVNKDRFW